jgi:antitoxin MazE
VALPLRFTINTKAQRHEGIRGLCAFCLNQISKNNLVLYCDQEIKPQICIFNVYTIMEAKVKKWGNSLGVRIPKSISTKVGITEGTSIEFSIEGDKIILAPVPPKEYTIEEMILQVSEENLHYEITTDGPIGKEVW